MEHKFKHDGKLQLAFGSNRFETKWKNRQLSWSQLVGKLATTSRTGETRAEYAAMTTDQQTRIKDVGGFVGGPLKGGRRKAENVQQRQLLTLDLDYARADTWSTFTTLHDNAACIYSTHKHAPDKPRLRLVMPLSRPVTPEEYAALGRKFAFDAGLLDQCDDTTFECHRLMFWPSTSADAEYFFDVSDGPWLDPDVVLASYGPDEAWRDSSRWPESGKTIQDRHDRAKKQGDPLTKTGLIGAFCRTYSIAEAIGKFLPDVYIEAGPNRWTFAAGSTAAGAVEYGDGRWLYSNHGTDPVSGELVNAFDLVRIHLYGHLDEKSNEGKGTAKLPSSKAMRTLALSDDAVKLTLDEERLAGAQTDFTPIQGDEKWASRLILNDAGKPKANAHNIETIFNCDPKLELKNVVKDLFRQRVIIVGPLAWSSEKAGTTWSDEDEAALRNYMDRRHDITGKNLIADGLSEFLMRNAVHPVREYLSGLEWDGINRVDTLLIDYLGAADNPYTRAVSKLLCVAAVARISQPGCKFDYMPILTGRQGIGKSFFLAKLARNPSWFSDSLTQMAGSKDAYEQLRGKWIFEISELSAASRSAVETIKLFVSKQIDTYRPAYGHNLVDFPRQCVFVGTTNREDFLHDPTGNRRFLPIKVGKTKPEKNVFTELRESEVDQIWAEAVALYNAGGELYLKGSLAESAAEAAEMFLEESEKQGQIKAFLEKELPDEWNKLGVYERRNYIHGRLEIEGPKTPRTKTCVSEIWAECFEGDSRNLDRQQTREIRDVMMRMPGWSASSKKLRFKHYGPQRGYVNENVAVDVADNDE